MQPANVVGLQESHPGAHLLADARADRLADLDRADRLRYSRLSHLPGALDELGVAGRRVLEVGLGCGAEAEQLVRRGALVSGLDLDPAVVAAVAQRLKDRELRYDALRHGDVADLPWPDDSFDVVFSHGLLDRVDGLGRAASELRRVLRPGGQLVVMVRARRSWRYRVTLPAMRAGLTALVPLARVGLRLPGTAGALVAAARREGRATAFADDVLLAVHDGPDRAAHRVLTRDELSRAFAGFTVMRSHQHVGPRVLGPLTRWFGWHLWVHFTPEA